MATAEIQLNDPQTLYEHWERNQWSLFDLDFSVDRASFAELDEESREGLMWIFAHRFDAEFEVARLLPPFVVHAPDYDVQLVCLRDGGAIVGYFALSQIFRLGFQNAYLGYDGSAPYGGQGFMTEGMELILRHAFRSQGLHRIEANIQPGNAASIALARSAGFRLEGFSPRYLLIGGRWRDHERYAITAEERRGRR